MPRTTPEISGTQIQIIVAETAARLSKRSQAPPANHDSLFVFGELQGVQPRCLQLHFGSSFALHSSQVPQLLDARLLGQFEADVALQQQLEESRLKEKMSGFAKGTQSRRHFRVSFNSKALSKYVLQNVM